MKIAFIHDYSEGYVNFVRDLILEEWGETTFERKKRLKDIQGTTLFGSSLPVVISIDNKNDVDDILSELQHYDKEDSLPSLCSSGLIISSSYDMRSFKKIKTFATGKNFSFYERTVSKKENETDAIIRQFLFVHSHVRKFLVDYIGNDFTQILPIIRALRKTPKEEQEKLSIEEVFIMLPRPQGSVMPWEITPFLLSGKKQQLIHSIRRNIKDTQTLLGFASYMRNYFLKLSYINIILKNNPSLSRKDVSEALGVANTGAVYYLMRDAQLFTYRSLFLAVEKFDKIISDVKNGLYSNIFDNTEIQLLNIVEILERGKF